MGSFFVTLQQQPRQTLYGLHRYTNDRDQSRDIPMLSGQFYDRTGGKPQPAPAFYVVSRDYEPSAGAFVLFVGDGGSGRQSAMLPGARTSQVPRRVSEENPAAVPD